MAKKNKTPSLITHFNPDADAIFALCIVLMFVENFKYARILLRKSNWDGKGVKGPQMIVDIWARGKGHKGDNDPKTGKMLSAFGRMVRLCCPPDIQKILAPLARFLDLEDSTPSAAHELLKQQGLDDKTRRQFEAHGLKMIFRVLSRHCGNDLDKLIALMTIILNGYIEQRQMELRGKNLNEKFISLAEFSPAWVVRNYGKKLRKARISKTSKGEGLKIGLDQFQGGILDSDLAFEKIIQDVITKPQLGNNLLKLKEVMAASADSKTLAEHMLKTDDQEAIDVLNSASLETIFRSFQIHCQEDIKRNNFGELTRLMDIMLYGYLEDARIWKEAWNLAKKAIGKDPSANVLSKVRTIGRDVALVTNVDNPFISGILFGLGFKFVVRVDGNNVIVQPNNRTYGLTIHQDEFYEVVMLAGEILADIGFDSFEGEWFIHIDGHTFARGTKTSPVDTPSKVDPWELCIAAKQAWDRLEPAFWASPEGQEMINKEREKERLKLEAIAQAAVQAAVTAQAETDAQEAAEAQAKADADAKATEEADAEAQAEADAKAAKMADKKAKKAAKRQAQAQRRADAEARLSKKKLKKEKKKKS